MEEQNSLDRRRIELVWRERLPLGMNLLMNDDSGFLKVVDFPRGSVSSNNQQMIIILISIFFL